MHRHALRIAMAPGEDLRSRALAADEGIVGRDRAVVAQPDHLAAEIGEVLRTLHLVALAAGDVEQARPVGIAAAVWLEPPHLQWWVVGGLGLFGFAFAVNSSVHSYLILAYAGSEKAAEDVGFYYAANALGRFFGTLMSGLLYQWGGLLYALVGSALMLFTCWLLTLALPTRLVPPGRAASVS